jgi:hypothetical protein
METNKKLTYGDVLKPMGILTNDDIKKHDSPLWDKTDGKYPDTFSGYLAYASEPYKLCAFDFGDISTPQATYTMPNSPKWKGAMKKHENLVKSAVKEGKKVPLVVLWEYPELMPLYVEKHKV